MKLRVYLELAEHLTREAYPLAYHLNIDDRKRRLMVAVKIEGAWLFSERLLYVDCIEERALS